MAWFSCGDSKGVSCCGCGKRIELEPFIDHHDRVCPHCHVTCVFLLSARWTQIVAAEAPLSVKAFVEWSQRNLDELEFCELLVFLEEAVTAPPPSEAPPRSCKNRV
jgi:hypothetical protein